MEGEREDEGDWEKIKGEKENEKTERERERRHRSDEGRAASSGGTRDRVVGWCGLVELGWECIIVILDSC